MKEKCGKKCCPARKEGIRHKYELDGVVRFPFSDHFQKGRKAQILSPIFPSSRQNKDNVWTRHISHIPDPAQNRWTSREESEQLLAAATFLSK